MTAAASPRGRRAAIAAACVACAVILVAAWPLRRWVLEKKYLAALDSKDEDAVMAAVEALAEMQSVKALPRLEALLEPRNFQGDGVILANGGSRHPKPGLDRLSETLLRAISRLDGPAFARLTESAPGWPVPRQDWFPEAVIAFEREGRTFLPVVLALAERGSSSARDSAFRAIADWGPAAKAALPLALREARDTRAADRAEALRALGALEASAAEVLPVLLEALGDPSERTRAAAAEACGVLGSAASPAKPKLLAVIRGEAGTASRAALKSLPLIDPTLVPSVRPMEMLLFGKDQAVRAIAVDALEDPAHAHERAAPRLAARMKSLRTEAEKQDAAKRVAAMGTAAVAPLRGALTHQDPLNRRIAAETLAGMGPKAVEALATLLDVAKWDDDPDVRRAAAHAALAVAEPVR